MLAHQSLSVQHCIYPDLFIVCLECETALPLVPEAFSGIQTQFMIYNGNEISSQSIGFVVQAFVHNRFWPRVFSDIQEKQVKTE